MANRKYGPDNNMVSSGLDKNYHDGEEGYDRLTIDVAGAKSGLFFGLATGMQEDTYFKKDGLQVRLYQESEPGAKGSYHLKDIAERFVRHNESFSNNSNMFALEKGGDFIRYTGFEEVNILGTEHNDFIPYLNGSEYHGGVGSDVFYADWRNWTTDITWKNNSNKVTFTPGIDTLPAVSISGMENLYLYLGSGNDEIVVNDYSEIHGGAGDDRLAVERSGGRLYGGEGNDTLINKGTITGTYGEPIIMVGGLGDDTYHISPSDIVEELPDEGTDTIVTNSANFDLRNYANIEYLTSLSKEVGGTLHGNATYNRIESGGNGATMYGHTGNDTYIVRSLNDKVIEQKNEGNYDGVESYLAVYTLPDNVERLDSQNSSENNILIGNNLSNYITGNSRDDRIYGKEGNDALSGGRGNDLLEGGVGEDFLWGEEGNDKLYGGDAYDYLEGGAGADQMWGGVGDDMYDVEDAGDQVYENPDEGIDKVRTNLAVYTLPDNVEKLETYNFNDNTILTGNHLDNEIIGYERDDQLYGKEGKDNLYGNGGNDLLDGGEGVDHLEGGAGNDRYYVDNAGDKVIEKANEGEDWVYSSVLFDLRHAPNVEHAQLTGKGNVALLGSNGSNHLIGNDGNNQIRGLDGNDILEGGKGKDVLLGGAGRDTFKFADIADSTLSLRDVILDFKRGEDKIDLSVIDANTTQSGNQAFNFIGAAGFSAAGQVRFAGGVVYGDVNGDKQADFAIELKNVTTLQAGDFIL